MAEPGLPELCDAGVTCDRCVWQDALVGVKCDLESGRRSYADAGHLGFLLALAGRTDRALEVFAMLDDLASGGSTSAGGRGLGEMEPARPSDYLPAERGGLRSGTNSISDMYLLAALVLSGRWAEAYRCCRRLMSSDQAVTPGMEGSVGR